ncbi:MAG: hypothetical protein PHD76_10445 [Methylacidiphilales bacterium]|nr:hypothetical protein [Candidatus Methylacidiphilales bacterium]
MKYILFGILAFTYSHVYAEPVFRDSYAVDLTLNDGSKFQKEIKKVPYVADGVIYIFPGESFSVGIEIGEKGIKEIYYDKGKSSKIGLDFNFKQEKLDDGKRMMMLTVVSRLPQTLSYEALMVIPEVQGVKKTSVVPIEAGLSSYESWPHPIMQLALRNFKLEDKNKKSNQPVQPTSLRSSADR